MACVTLTFNHLSWNRCATYRTFQFCCAKFEADLSNRQVATEQLRTSSDLDCRPCNMKTYKPQPIHKMTFCSMFHEDLMAEAWWKTCVKETGRHTDRHSSTQSRLESCLSQIQIISDNNYSKIVKTCSVILKRHESGVINQIWQYLKHFLDPALPLQERGVLTAK